MEKSVQNAKEKILIAPLSIPFSGTASCELRVPGLPAIKSNIDVRFDGRHSEFDLPKTDIADGVGWYDFKDGAQGQLVHEENYGQALGNLADGKKVFLDKCLIRERSWDEQPVKYVSAKGVSCHLLEIIAKPTPKVLFESYVIGGFTLPHWPDFTSKDTEDEIGLSMDRLSFSSPFGAMTIRKLDGDFARILFEESTATPYSHQKNLESILPFLGFVCGRRLYLIKKEVFDNSGELIQEAYLKNVVPQIHPQPSSPIPLSPEYESQLIYQLPVILEKYMPSYLDWKTNIFIDEAIFHLHSALTSALESKFSILSICFETLASSYSRFKNGDQTEASTYLERKDFNKKMAPIFKEFESSLKSTLSPEDYESMLGKLRGINNRAMTSKFKAIFSDLNLKLSKSEEGILGKRNPAIHDGVLTRNREKIDWQEILQYEGVMLTIVHRVFLRLLGYTEKTVDYGTAGYPEVEV
jgi:hypothetical protein